MTRAYIRLDPAFDERKESYPDGPYAALIATFCLAELQPARGRFRSLDYLTRLLGRRGRHVRYLVDHGDVLLLPDGRIYVDGWDEWQEGDWKVGERLERLRIRREQAGMRRNGSGPRATAGATVSDTQCATAGATAGRLDSAGAGRAPAEIQRGSTATPGAVGRANGRVDPVEGSLS